MKNGVPDMLFAWKQGVSSYGTLEFAIRMSVTRPYSEIQNDDPWPKFRSARTPGT